MVVWPLVWFHPRVGNTIHNQDLPQLLMQAHLVAGTWVEGRRGDHRGLWRADVAVPPPIAARLCKGLASGPVHRTKSSKKVF